MCCLIPCVVVDGMEWACVSSSGRMSLVFWVDNDEMK